ncbi:membrane associated rhomboid family serine protease [Flavobacteriaceae bacterium MAR_2010_72]|nr:membrane associated rhomboid family serine protease [Flavobacteriaceae bacterium MAR_2010_72]
MTSLTQDIQDKIKRLNVFEKIIIVNAVIFSMGWLIARLRPMAREESLVWLELPKQFSEFIVKPWSLLTYGFAHYGFFHLVFNLLVLYFVARMMVNLFSTKISLNVYVLGILAGGLSYLLVYNLLPASYSEQIGSLVGASAGVRALLIFICAYMPNREARFFAIHIKLWHIGAVLVALDVIGLFSLNQGGSVAHLGGIALGYIYAVQLTKGRNIGKRFERFTGMIENLFKAKSPLKTVHKSRKKPFAGHNKNEFNEFTKQKRIDLILDKISKSGYDSLTKEEKEFLFKAGKD